MITPRQARRYIENTGAAYGQNVELPDVVDTRGCGNFFGMRCDANVHVKGPRTAHVDRVDPRHDPIGHLKKDVGVPYALIGACVGAGIGGVVVGKNRKKGAAVGALGGGIAGLVVDLLAERRDETIQAV